MKKKAGITTEKDLILPEEEDNVGVFEIHPDILDGLQSILKDLSLANAIALIEAIIDARLFPGTKSPEESRLTKLFTEIGLSTDLLNSETATRKLEELLKDSLMDRLPASLKFLMRRTIKGPISTFLDLLQMLFKTRKNIDEAASKETRPESEIALEKALRAYNSNVNPLAYRGNGTPEKLN